MRPMNRLARKTRAAMRRPPRSLAAIVLRRGGIAVGGCFLVGLGASLLWQSNFLWTTLGRAEAALLDVSAAGGGTVERIEGLDGPLASRAQVIHILEDLTGQNILAVEIAELRERLERLPWIKEAAVARSLPSTLSVRLEEYQPIARWHDGARQVLVSEAGTVLHVGNAQRYSDLPLLRGRGAPAEAAALVRLIASDRVLRDRVTGAVLIDGRRWDVNLGSTVVRLPSEEPDGAWQRLAAQQRAKHLLDRAVAVVDLRHPQWLTVRLADPPRVSPARPST